MSANVRIRICLLLTWGVGAAAASIHAAAPANSFQHHTIPRPQTKTALRLRGGSSPPRNGLSSVQFVVESPNLADDEYIGIVGSHEELGNWEASKAMLLKKRASPFADRSISTKRIDLPAGQVSPHSDTRVLHDVRYCAMVWSYALAGTQLRCGGTRTCSTSSLSSYTPRSTSGTPTPLRTRQV
eukprot:3400411-Rhodomonas_salina.5